MCRRRSLLFYSSFLAAALWANGWSRAEEPSATASLWDVAQEKAGIHRFATLFTAHDVRESLSSEDGLTAAIDWCKATGVTVVHLEVFRDGYQADRETLGMARDRFRKDGFIVHRCVTTTQLGKRSTGWQPIACYTHPETQNQLVAIFRLAAELFDVVMIDDFWLTDCECAECQQARGDQSWSQYRRQLMHRVTEECVLRPAREVNPQVQVIIKYPEWYDQFHERGYDVESESKLFDITWIGTESRDPDSTRWGKKPQYGAYWISLWARAFSGNKLGGGWYDPLGTTPNTYVEQARQTILGQCPSSLLFCYGALHQDHGPADIAALRGELPGLWQLAEFVQGEPPRGVGSYKPANSDPGADTYIFNFLGMLGLPMTAAIEFPHDAPSLLVTEHAAADPNCEASCLEASRQGKVLLITSNLLARLSPTAQRQLDGAGIQILKLDPAVKSEYGVLRSIRNLLDLPREELDAWRKPLLEPLGVQLSAPPLVALYLFGPQKVVVENFRDEPVTVELALRGKTEYKPAVVLPQESSVSIVSAGGKASITLAPRSLVALHAVR